jgi:ribose transport system permease protein
MNGVLITVINLPPFIATLGTMSICRGLIYVITRGNPLTPVLAPSYIFIGQGYVGVVPMPVIIMIILVVIFQFCMKQTCFGRYVYALGGNEQASRLSGVKTNKVKLQVYTLAGFLSGIAGIILYARMTSAEAAAGLGEEMNVIAATVIGGASMSGGAGSVIGALIGAILIGVIKNGMVLLNINSYAQQAVTGVVILFAVGIDMIRQKKD